MASLQWLLITLLASATWAADTGSSESQCKSWKDCGWNTRCVQGQCQCRDAFSLSPNGKDCTNRHLCGDPRCIDCYSKDECRRCVDYVEDSTGRCLDQCDQRYRLVIEGDFVGKVCRASHEEPVINRLYLSIVLGVGMGMTLIALMLIIVCCQMCGSSTKSVEKLQEKKQVTEHKRKERQFIAQFVHENHIYESTRYEHRRVNRTHYSHQVERLQPHMDTFLDMLREAKRSLQYMLPDDPRAHTFNNIIPQLCRVISLLNDSTAEMPPDGNLLLQWALRLLKDYLSTRKDSQEGSVFGTLTSTFKPDHRIVEQHLPGDRNSAGTTFKYERFLGPDCMEMAEVAEIHSIKLSDGNLTDPIEV